MSRAGSVVKAIGFQTITQKRKTKIMRYTITVIHKNKAPEVFDTDDRDFEEAMKTAEMFASMFPDATIQIN